MRAAAWILMSCVGCATVSFETVQPTPWLTHRLEVWTRDGVSGVSAEQLRYPCGQKDPCVLEAYNIAVIVADGVAVAERNVEPRLWFLREGRPATAWPPHSGVEALQVCATEDGSQLFLLERHSAVEASVLYELDLDGQVLKQRVLPRGAPNWIIGSAARAPVLADAGKYFGVDLDSDARLEPAEQYKACRPFAYKPEHLVADRPSLEANRQLSRGDNSRLPEGARALIRPGVGRGTRRAKEIEMRTLGVLLLIGCSGEISTLKGAVDASSVGGGGGVAGGTGGAGGGGTSMTFDAGGSGGGSSFDAGTDAGTDAGKPPVDGGGYFIPNPIVSVGAPMTASGSSQNAALAFDGRLDTGEWTGPTPAADGTVSDMWVRLQLGSGSPCVGPSAVLLVWHTLEDPDYIIDTSVNYGTPNDYLIETSVDGTSWTSAVAVTSPAQTYRSRGNRVDFTGQCYLRLTIQKMHTTMSGRNPAIAEVSVYDVSNGNDDSWVFLGNGPVRFAYDRHVYPDFPADVTAKHARYSPATLDAADLEGSLDYVSMNLDAWLMLNGDFKNWVLALGMEEAGNGSTPADVSFTSKMQALIDRLTAAGHPVLIPHLPYTSSSQYPHLSEFNAAIDQLVASNHLMAAPDLYAYFQANPSLLCSSANDCESNWIGIAPSDPAGYVGLNQSWADAVDAHYAP